MAKKIKGIDLGLEIGKILKEYQGEIEKEVALSSYEVGEAVVESLHQTSPVGTDTPNRGRYAKGWTYGEAKSSLGRINITVYNETDWQLTHLLEFGHALKRGGRTIGQVGRYQHILQRRNLAEELLMKKVEEQLQK